MSDQKFIALKIYFTQSNDRTNPLKYIQEENLFWEYFEVPLTFFLNLCIQHLT